MLQQFFVTIFFFLIQVKISIIKLLDDRMSVQNWLKFLKIKLYKLPYIEERNKKRIIYSWSTNVHN